MHNSESADKSNFRKIIKTEDGSHTLYVPQLNENYHSTHGAIQEAEHIFIKEALAYAAKDRKCLNVLEIGFGTGLNAFLSLLFAKQNNLEVFYHGLEKYPVAKEEYSILNFAFEKKSAQVDFLNIHQVEWGRSIEVIEGFSLKKEQVDFREMQLPSNYFDVVYFDAFGPDVQPDLWTEKVFQLIVDSMKKGAVMTTYSVKGAVRRAMKSVGFDVKKIPGPPGKREISRAIKV